MITTEAVAEAPKKEAAGGGGGGHDRWCMVAFSELSTAAMRPRITFALV